MMARTRSGLQEAPQASARACAQRGLRAGCLYRPPCQGYRRGSSYDPRGVTYRAGVPYGNAPVLCYNERTYIGTGASHWDSGLSRAVRRSETIERGSHAEAELVALARDRQNSRLWRNGKGGGWCLGYRRISASPAAAFRADLKGDYRRVWAGGPPRRCH